MKTICQDPGLFSFKEPYGRIISRYDYPGRIISRYDYIDRHVKIGKPSKPSQEAFSDFDIV